jgi:ankyrin repeat protein
MTYAISNGIANLAQAIIASGYDPNLPVNSTNNTPLANAAELEREEIVEILLKAGAQINHQSAATNNIALHYACHSKNDNPAIINKLIQAGATVNAPTKSGLTPLMIAISKGHLSQVKALLAAKARVDMKAIPHNKSEWTALDFAKKYPMPDDIRAEIIKLLKKHGAQE